MVVSLTPCLNFIKPSDYNQMIWGCFQQISTESTLRWCFSTTYPSSRIILDHLPKKSGIPWNSSEKVLFLAVFLQVVASTSCGIPMATRWAPAPVAAASPTRPGKHGDTATRPRRHQESENHGFFGAKERIVGKISERYSDTIAVDCRLTYIHMYIYTVYVCVCLLMCISDYDSNYRPGTGTPVLNQPVY